MHECAILVICQEITEIMHLPVYFHNFYIFYVHNLTNRSQILRMIFTITYLPNNYINNIDIPRFNLKMYLIKFSELYN